MSLTWSVNNELRPGYVVSDNEAKARAWIGRQTDASRYTFVAPDALGTFGHADVVLVANKMTCEDLEVWGVAYPEAKLVFV